MGSLKERSISLGPWGGADGDYWSFKAIHGIVQISIHHGDNIKSISFKDDNGHHSGIFGGTNQGDLGTETRVDIQWPSEYLTSITGSYGDYQGEQVVLSLKFNTNLTHYGPYGKENSGTSFSIPMQDGVVSGFYGRSDRYLNALGIYVKPGQEEGRISFGPWGGESGSAWSYMASSGINEIVVHDDSNNIKSICFGDVNGQHSQTFGGTNPSDTGEEKTIKIGWPSEYLTSIEGTYGHYVHMVVITSLSFVTNQTTHGPFGSANTADVGSFSIPIGEGAVVGFHGRCGHYLDALGIFVKPKFLKGAITMGPWGSQGGGPWSFIASRGIKEIIVGGDSDNIKSIAFRDVSGLDSGTFGGGDPDHPGSKNRVAIDWPSEYLMSITGTYGDYLDNLTITSLSFTTNRKTYGPFGSASGTSFSIPVDEGVIVGFHGRAGYYLDAIGFYVKSVRD